MCVGGDGGVPETNTERNEQTGEECEDESGHEEDVQGLISDGGRNKSSPEHQVFCALIALRITIINILQL